MARLPTVGGDYGNWGTVLNEYLETAHNADGTLKLDVQTIDDLKAIDVATLTDKQQALVAGYSAPGDGGGGQFYYDAAASEADNGGTILAPTAGAGRWLRNYSGAVNVKWFGLRLDGSDETAALQAVIDSITAVAGVPHKKHAELFFPGEQASIKLVPVSGNTCIVASSCRLTGQGCTIDLSELTADQIGIDTGSDMVVRVRRWERGATISGFSFIGSGEVAYGLKISKPDQLFSHLAFDGFFAPFKFSSLLAGGPYMCGFSNIRVVRCVYGVYWPEGLITSGPAMNFDMCDFAHLDLAVYVDHAEVGGYGYAGSWNFNNCTFDNCKGYIKTFRSTLVDNDIKMQLSFVNCWFEEFLREGSTYSIEVLGGSLSFVGCKWVENGAWTAGSMFRVAAYGYVDFVGCTFDLVNAHTSPIGTIEASTSVSHVNCRTRESNKLYLAIGYYHIGERFAKVHTNVPTTIPWGTVTPAAGLTEVGNGAQHGVIGLNNYNKATICAVVTEAGPTGSYLGVQVKRSGSWYWLDDIAGDQTTGAGKILLSATGVVTGSVTIKHTFFSGAALDTHEYRLVTYGGDGADSVTLSDLSIALE